ncbi:MAG: hypothetical protein L0Z70_06420 [Chloroflexi bacterium]|nr:hypothetical protein [Chloroflexota bacterium]
MIDWPNLFFNALWILGLAAGLATCSYASWQASLSGEKTLARLKLPAAQAGLDIAGLLFCLGLAGVAAGWLERTLWLALSAGFVVLLIQTRRKRL